MENPLTPAQIGAEPQLARRAGLPAASVAEEEVSLIAMANALLRHWVALVALPLAFAVIVGMYLAISPREFTATAVVMPRAQAGTDARLAGLAAQFGVNVGGQGGGETLDFYSALPHSRQLLDNIILAEYVVPHAGADSSDLRGSLIKLYDIRGDSHEEQLQNAETLLRAMINVSSDANSGLLKLSVAAPLPSLAVSINRRLLNELNDFNLHRRQSQARAEREFLEGRLGDARHQLESAEAALAQFADANRHYEESPILTLQAARLQRRVDVQQQVYATLAQAYEQARIDQVRNTPVITVIDAPEGSAIQTAPKVLKSLAIAILLGMLCAIAYAFVRQYLDTRRELGDDDYVEFVELRSAVLRRISPVRFRRRARAGPNN
jgi:uncharacterized protein involved in exopolysaccharide biosynthesis